MENLRHKIPDFAKDVRLNLTSMLTGVASTGLSKDQAHGTVLSVAYATLNKALIQDIEAVVEVNETVQTAAKSAASIMAMNNVYYRTVKQSGNDQLAQLPAGLRMQVIGKPGVAKVDFELFCLAVSALNGCNHCVSAHSDQLSKAGMAITDIQWAVKAAAIIQATHTAISI